MCHGNVTAQNFNLVFNGIDDSAQCTGCTTGYYIDTEYDLPDKCRSNESNESASVVLGTNGLACKPCPKGMFSADNISSTCSVCPVGHAQPQTSRGYCEPCSRGT